MAAISASSLALSSAVGERTPDPNSIIKLADYFGVTTDELLVREPKAAPIKHKVPLLGPIKAGVPILSTDNYTETVEPPNGVIADFAAPVEGDSMIYAGIHPGDIAFFRKCNEPRPGYIVAARVLDYDAAVNLKFFVQKNGQAVLRSANPEYEDIPFTKNHAVVDIMSRSYLLAFYRISYSQLFASDACIIS